MADSLDKIFADLPKLINYKLDTRLMKLFAAKPEAARQAVERIFRESPNTPPGLGAAIQGLAAEDFEPLTKLAVESLRRNPAQRSQQLYLDYASQQSLASLKPHLRKLFRIRKHAGYHGAMWPWRESGTRELEFLQERGNDLAAILALFQMRENKGLQLLAKRLPKDTFQWRVREVGFERRARGFRQLYSNETFHLAFPPGHFDEFEDEAWLPMPGLPMYARGGPHLLGGKGTGECSECGETLAHLLTFEGVPKGLGVSKLRKLSLQACLPCVERGTLFYKHNGKGEARALTSNVDLPDDAQKLPRLKRVRVTLIETPSRWRWQDWAMSNGRENLNRVGGHPTWIQNANYPVCPKCQETMVHLLQLDSNLRTEDGYVVSWGAQGICYVAWCDTCKVSAVQTQYT